MEIAIVLNLFKLAAEKVTDYPPEWVFRMRQASTNQEFQLRLTSSQLQEVFDIFHVMRPMVENADTLINLKKE